MIDFRTFYTAVHGRAPFPWQERLAAAAFEGEWPAAISIPTGCGKTSVLDAAVFALAEQAGSSRRTAPLRTFFVVDRRLVVDDVTEHAKSLACAIERDERLAEIKERLNWFGGSRPLDVAVLRGGMYRNDTWADLPNQPLVCVSTVDQVGSRLLFRGYGTSDLRRPVDAGLVGSDSLVIVDEAHLSKPFLDTLEWVRFYQGERWRTEAAAPGLRFVTMSATGAEGFGLEQDDYDCPAIADRIRARKEATFVEASNVPQTAAEAAERLADGGAAVVGVVLNTVAAARACFDAVRGEKLLLTGRVRPYDRDRLIERYGDRIAAQRERPDGERLIVVATQTIEVGADVDFDALVTECAPMDSLRQRFGRLDRLGRRRESRAVVLKKKGKESDPVYGETARKTWEWLTARGATVDFGIAALTAWPEELNRAREDGPLMFPAHVETWAQTHPTPAADPEVAPFLHGRAALEAADVQIVWRADLEGTPDDWREILEAAPPLSTEALPLPIRTARRWLAGETGAATDIEGVTADAEGAVGQSMRRHLIWRGPGEEGERLRPGDTIVVAASEGGCDEYGWNPKSEAPVRDIGDLCATLRARSGGGSFRLRVHPRVLPGDANELARLLQAAADDEDGALEKIREHVEAIDPSWREIRFEWGRARRYGPGDALLVEAPRPGRVRVEQPDDTDARNESSMTGRRTLREHTEGVVALAREFLRACGIAGGAAAAVIAAAERHDWGKCDSRFQILLGNGAGEPMGKSDACSAAEQRRRRELAEYPEGARHEFASVALAAQFGRWDGCDPELALYLIGTHHGYGRPLPPVWKDTATIRGRFGGDSVEVRNVADIARLDSGWLERHRQMARTYGWWGIAYLEGILRRADCVHSRKEEG